MINKKNIRDLLLNDIDDYLILFEDTANIESLETEYSNEYRFFSDEAKEFINKNFLKENKESDNYTLYGLRNFETYGGKIFISFEKGDYKTYLASKLKEYKNFIAEKNFFVVPIFVMSIVVTKDNKILTLNQNGEWLLPSGVVTDENVNGDNMDILDCADQNLKNYDLGLYDSKIVGIYKSRVSCVIVLNQKTSKSSSELTDMKFINNNITTLGKIISDNTAPKRMRQAFKFHLKENFNNYDYINIKLK